MRQDIQQARHPVNILDFGARPSSGELCTAAIPAVIDQAGPGSIHIPAGEFLTGTINLKQAHRVILENIWISPYDGLAPELYRPDRD